MEWIFDNLFCHEIIINNIVLDKISQTTLSQRKFRTYLYLRSCNTTVIIRKNLWLLHRLHMYFQVGHNGYRGAYAVCSNVIYAEITKRVQGVLKYYPWSGLHYTFVSLRYPLNFHCIIPPSPHDVCHLHPELRQPGTFHHIFLTMFYPSGDVTNPWANKFQTSLLCFCMQG